MKKYELLLILSSASKEEERANALDKLKTMLTAEKAQNVEVNNWGLKKFAYPINYKNEGHYVLFTFVCEPTVPAKLEKHIGVTEIFVRHMFTIKA